MEELAKLDAAELARRIAWETNTEPRNPEEAARALVASITYLLDTHGWEVTWDTRGIRLHHADHHAVLGVPANVADFVAATA